MPPKKRTIVEQLRHAIAESGETEYAIAKGAGVSQSVVNRFANGERGISLETAAKLCDYLIEQDNPAAARSVAEQIERTVGRLSQYPLSGRQGTVAGTREIVVPGLPYLVVYRVTDAEVQILRVFHSKRERH